jgi:hypothetical protein
MVDVQSIIGGIISFFNGAYIASLSLFWYVAVHYGLDPRFSYVLMENPGSGYEGLYSYLVNSIYIEAGGIFIILFSLYLLVSNALNNPMSPMYGLLRYFIAFCFVFFSADFCRVILEASSIPFSLIWNSQGGNWYSMLSVLNVKGEIISVSASNAIVEFFLLSALFISTVSLMGMLELRQAIILFLILTLPVFSLLIGSKRTEKFPQLMWKTFIELSIMPFFVIMVLRLISFFPYDFLLQVGLLFLASAMPLLIMTNSRIFQSSMLNSLFEGTNAENIVDRVASTTSSVFNFAENPGPGSFGAMMGIRSSNHMKGSAGPVENYRSGSNNIDWHEIYSGEMNFRKDAY